MTLLSHKILYMQHANSKKAKIVIKILADLIKEMRMAKNKSQRLLAYEYDIQKSMLSRLENGINEPKLVSILTICEALEIKPSALFLELEKRLPKDFSLIDK